MVVKSWCLHLPSTSLSLADLRTSSNKTRHPSKFTSPQTSQTTMASTQQPIQIHIQPGLQKHAISLDQFYQRNPEYQTLVVGSFIFHPPTSTSTPSEHAPVSRTNSRSLRAMLVLWHEAFTRLYLVTALFGKGTIPSQKILTSKNLLKS